VLHKPGDGPNLKPGGTGRKPALRSQIPCPTLALRMDTLYYGDNLDILRRYLKDETVDPVYLDPPFNSAQHISNLRSASVFDSPLRSSCGVWPSDFRCQNLRACSL